MHIISSRSPLVMLVLLVALAACDESARRPGPTPTLAPDDSPLETAATGVFHRYVAIGTSVSMGWRSDGVIAAYQDSSWPAQLTRMSGRSLTQPYIATPGCRSPLVAPLALGRRLSGEPAGANPATLSCAPNVDGVTLPTRNLAINAATTRDALYTTPDNVTDPANSKLYREVLPSGATQVSAMMAQNPKLVSVEFGGNEVLNARSGIAVEGLTLTPYAAWAPMYDALLDSVAKVSKMALLVGLTSDVGTFPAFRRGAELYADRAEFLAFNVRVSEDCNGSRNLIFVPVVVPTAVATGAALGASGPASLSCAEQGTYAQDFILDPGEQATVNSLLAVMDAHIRAEAARRGYAFFALGSLYDRPDLKGPFSVGQLMLTAAPYGPLISLDGVHPTAAGSTVLARAAADALDARYDLGIPLGFGSIASRP